MAQELIEHVNRHAAMQRSTIFAEQLNGNSALRSISYSDFHDVVSGWVCKLDNELPSGCTVSLYGPNSIDFLIVFTAILASGRVAFPLHPHLTIDEVRDAIIQSNAKTVIAPTSQLSSVVSDHCFTMDLADHPPQSANCLDPQRAESAGLYLQSSGTTGLPKIVHRMASSLDAVARTLTNILSLTTEDCILAVVPMCHSYGVENALLAPIYSGARIHIAQGFSLDVTLQQFEKDDVTIFPCVPFIFESLASVDFKTTERLRHVFSAGAPLPLKVQNAFCERFGSPIEHLYGASEVGTITFNPRHLAATHPNSVGKVVPGVEIRILDATTPDINKPLANGETGQIAVSSDAMLSDYIGHHKENITDGFFLTGDLGSVDAEGYLYLTGRVKLQIDVGGLKVNPLEVEQELINLEGIREAVVLPLPVTSTLYRLRAVIVLDSETDSISVETIRNALRTRLAPHKIPRVFEFHESLPRSPTGKILRLEVPAPCE